MSDNVKIIESNDMMKLNVEVHQKVWGEEHWLINDKKNNYCGKKLILKNKFRCSLHAHKNKDECFYVLKGKIAIEEDCGILGWTICNPGDVYHVCRGSLHRFNGLEDSELIEFSTFHEDEDSYRVDGELSGEIPDEIFERMLKSSNSCNR